MDCQSTKYQMDISKDVKVINRQSCLVAALRLTRFRTPGKASFAQFWSSVSEKVSSRLWSRKMSIWNYIRTTSLSNIESIRSEIKELSAVKVTLPWPPLGRFQSAETPFSLYFGAWYLRKYRTDTDISYISVKHYFKTTSLQNFKSLRWKTKKLLKVKVERK